MPRVPPPSSSFGSELQAALRKGMEKSYRITFSEANQAIRFKHRVNSLRAAMKREKHPDWQQLYRVGLYDDPKDPRVVVVAPKDSEFRTFLDAAGVEAIAPPLPVREVEVGPSAPGSVDDFLAEITEATSVQHNLASHGADEEPAEPLAPPGPKLSDL